MLLYADDLMISAKSIEELQVKLKTWKSEMEKMGLLQTKEEAQQVQSEKSQEI